MASDDDIEGIKRGFGRRLLATGKIWVQRLQWGLHAVLNRLGAEGDFNAALRPWLEGPLRSLPP